MRFSCNIGLERVWPAEWTPAFHDPAALDWAITLGYLAGAAICLHAWWKHRRDPPDPSEHMRGVWLALGIVMALLGVNKQLRFQTLLTDVAREAAAQQGAY